MSKEIHDKAVRSWNRHGRSLGRPTSTGRRRSRERPPSRLRRSCGRQGSYFYTIWF